jgi:uncharacterized protein (TIGR02118 family)
VSRRILAKSLIVADTDLTDSSTDRDRIRSRLTHLKRSTEYKDGVSDTSLGGEFFKMKMNRLTVLYGHPTDPEEFDRYYHEVHLPLARKMNGLRGWTIGKCQSAEPDHPPAYYMIVGLYAESREEMESILATPEGQACIADVANFATGGATFMYNDEDVLIPYSL